jgi:hypothetical protein
MSTSQILKVSLILCLILIPQYSLGLNSEPQTNPLANCPAQYFKNQPSGKTDFKTLKKVIQTYGKSKVFERIHRLSNNKSIVRRDDVFSTHYGIPPLNNIDECTMMYELIELDMSPSELEVQIIAAPRLAREAENTRLDQEARIAVEVAQLYEERARLAVERDRRKNDGKQLRATADNALFLSLVLSLTLALSVALWKMDLENVLRRINAKVFAWTLVCLFVLIILAVFVILEPRKGKGSGGYCSDMADREIEKDKQRNNEALERILIDIEKEKKTN